MTTSKEWEKRNRTQRLAYWKQHYQERRAKKLPEMRKYQIRYYYANKNKYRAANARYAIKHKNAIKVARNLQIPIADARLLLAAIPSRNVDRAAHR